MAEDEKIFSGIGVLELYNGSNVDKILFISAYIETEDDDSDQAWLIVPEIHNYPVNKNDVKVIQKDRLIEFFSYGRRRVLRRLTDSDVDWIGQERLKEMMSLVQMEEE
jgi:hypothetical protein